MKKLIVLSVLFIGVISAYSQTDSLLLVNYEQKILEISKLKNDLQLEKQNLSQISDAYKKDTLSFLKQIKDLRKELSSEKSKVTDLNKSKIKSERDKLVIQVDSLNIVILEQRQTISGKEEQISDLKTSSKNSVENAKNEGKAEAYASIANLYKNQSFDDIIKSSGKELVDRDIQLVGNNPEVMPVLNDLLNYFNALELLSQRHDGIRIKNAQTQLSQIKSQSELLDLLNEDLEFYQHFNNALKETIGKLVNLDKQKSADGDSVIQKLKFNEIITILADYIYNYYDYSRYQYLHTIVIEIIKRKRLNADTEITDLLMIL